MRKWETEYDATWKRIEAHPLSPLAAFGWGFVFGSVGATLLWRVLL